MTAAIIAATVIGVLVGLTVIGRTASRRKDEARKDLEREKEALKSFDIMDLVAEEAKAAGIEDIPGATDVELITRLRVWQRYEHVRDTLPEGVELRYVVADGVDPTEVGDEDVRLTWDGYVAPEPGENSGDMESPAGGTESLEG